MALTMAVRQSDEQRRLLCAASAATLDRMLAIDASDAGAVAQAAAGANLVVNAVVPEFNMAIMRACLEAGADYLDKCFEIRIKDYAIFDSPVPLQVWSQETYYSDCAQPPLLYEDGEFKRVEIFGRREHYQFPEPFGLGACICHDHEEVTTLPRLLPRKFGDKGLRYVDFKMPLSTKALSAVCGPVPAYPTCHAERW